MKLKFLIFLVLLYGVNGVLFFNSYADPPGEVNMGISNTVYNEKVLILKNPGKYRLIGIEAFKKDIYGKSDDEKVVVVQEHTPILVEGQGIYEITMECVNIDVKNIDENICRSAFEIGQDASVYLTLIGKNNIKNINGDIALGEQDSKELKITEESTGSLNVHGKKCGIAATNIIIDGGKISASSEEYTLYGNKIKINSGSIDIESKNIGIRGKNIEINEADVRISSGYCGINGGSTRIHSGIISVDSESCGIGSKSTIIDGGKITAFGKECSIEGDCLTINGGVIDVFSDHCAMAVKIAIINNGKVMASGEEYGIDIDNIIVYDGEIHTSSAQYAMAGKNINISGGKITAYAGQCGIFSNDSLIIKNGEIRIIGDNGIYAANITIENGDINLSVDKHSIVVVKKFIMSNGQMKTYNKCAKLNTFDLISPSKITDVIITGGIINGIQYPLKKQKNSNLEFKRDINNLRHEHSWDKHCKTVDGEHLRNSNISRLINKYKES